MSQEVAKEQIKSVEAWLAEQGVTSDETPPLAEAHGWMEFNNCLYITEVRYHPKAPDRVRKNVKTSKVRMLDRQMRLCLTQNTLYRLFDEVK